MGSSINQLDTRCPLLIDFLKHFNNFSNIRYMSTYNGNYMITYYNACPNYIAYMILKYKKNISSNITIDIGAPNRKSEIKTPNMRLNKLPSYYDFWRVWYKKNNADITFNTYSSLYNSHYPITITYSDNNLNTDIIKRLLSKIIIEIWKYMNDSEKALWINPQQIDNYDLYYCKRWMILYYTIFKNICVKRTKQEIIPIMLQTWKFIKNKLDYVEFDEYTSSVPYIQYRDFHKHNSKQLNISYINKYISAINTVHKFLRMKRFFKYCNSVAFWHPNNIGGKLHMKGTNRWLSTL